MKRKSTACIVILMISIIVNICCTNIVAFASDLNSRSRYYPEIVDIVAGGLHSVALDRSGDMFVFGSNRYGEIGLGTTSEEGVLYDVSIDDSGQAKKVSSRGDHVLAIGTDDKVYAWGYNNWGQLGTADILNRSSMTEVTGFNETIVDVAAGHQFSLALTESGEVYAWGHGGYGQLGTGMIENCSLSPVKVNIENVVQISAGHYHALAVKSDGTVWGWGRNSEGAIGNGEWTNVVTPVQINVENIKEVVAGFNNSFFITNSGDVYACGNNTGGELGDGTRENKIAPVLIEGISNVTQVTSNSCTIFLQDDGLAYGTGSNKSGQLGLGKNTGRVLVPTKIPGEGYTKVSTGGSHTLLYWGTTYSGGLYGGKIYAMGDNSYYQCGKNDSEKIYYPTEIDNIAEIDDRETWAPVGDIVEGTARHMITASEDTYISQNGSTSTQNYSNNQVCCVNYTRKENGTDDWGQYTYFKFNINEIDLSNIISAKLYLYIDENSDIRNSTRTIGIYGAESSEWNGETLTWSSGIIKESGALINTFEVSGNGSIIIDAGWREIDLYDYLLENNSSNISLIAKMISTTPHPVKIRSSENYNLKTVPILVIDYYVGDNIGDDFEKAFPINIGEEIHEKIEISSDIDFFCVEIENDNNYVVTVNDNDKFSETNIFNEDKILIGTFNNNETSSIFEFTKGKYYIKIENALNSKVEYLLNISEYIPDDFDNNDFDDAYNIDIPCNYKSHINSGNDIDYYSFVVKHPGYYIIEPNNPQIEIELYNENFEKIDINADSTSINLDASPKYYLKVFDMEEEFIGEYRIFISKVSTNMGDAILDGIQLELTLAGIDLSNDDRQYYIITPTETRAYTFSGAAASEILLYDENAQRVHPINKNSEHINDSVLNNNIFYLSGYDNKAINLEANKKYYLSLEKCTSHELYIKSSIDIEKNKNAQTILVGNNTLSETENEEVIYRFVAANTGIYEFKLNGKEIYSQFLYDANGCLINENKYISIDDEYKDVVFLKKDSCIYIKLNLINTDLLDLDISYHEIKNDLPYFNIDETYISENNELNLYVVKPDKDGYYQIDTYDSDDSIAFLLFNNKVIASSNMSSVSSNAVVNHNYDMNFSITTYLNKGNIYYLAVSKDDSKEETHVECNYIPITCGKLSGSELRCNPIKWDVAPRGNCYSYALNTTKCTYLEDQFSLQPGDLSYDRYSDATVNEILNSDQPFEKRIEEVEEYFFEVCSRDAKEVNSVFNRVDIDSPTAKGCYKVALVVSVYYDTSEEGYIMGDYHWYRQGSDGLWSHKLSICRNYDDSANDINIPAPSHSNNGEYNYLLGYYEVMDLSHLDEAEQYLNSTLKSVEKTTLSQNDIVTQSEISMLSYDLTKTEVENIIGKTSIHKGSGIIKDIYLTADDSYLVLQYNSTNDSIISAYIIKQNDIEFLDLKR